MSKARDSLVAAVLAAVLVTLITDAVIGWLHRSNATAPTGPASGSGGSGTAGGGSGGGGVGGF